MPHWRLYIFYKESVICFISTSHRFSFKIAFEDFVSFFSRGGGLPCDLHIFTIPSFMQGCSFYCLFNFDMRSQVLTLCVRLIVSQAHTHSIRQIR